GSARLFAGDPIDFSGRAGKGSSPRDSKADEERLKALQTPSRPALLPEGNAPDATPAITGPRETREGRRQRLAREERKYFLLYEPGKLQKKDREGKNTGWGDYTRGSRDEKSPGRDCLSDAASGARNPGGSRAKPQRKDNRLENLDNRARQ